jgi:phosphopantothenoylcysteine decarboxylase/phosphopantothenate--cysteine ligase
MTIDKPVKNIVLGISGGIAAYKAADLARRLCGAGMQVRVIMTSSATQFISPLTLSGLTGAEVHSAWLEGERGNVMPHIDLARWADLILVAPASANFIARLAHGFADDLLAATCLAATVPIAVAPAMNRAMWHNSRTQENVHRLRQQGVLIWGPEAGSQACGEEGPGRMVEPEQLLARVRAHSTSDSLRGLRCLVSAGPTREAIDPVRFISNRSSGKMGFAIADAASRAGAAVTLVSGPVNLPTPPTVQERIDVVTSEEMLQAVLAHAETTDIFVAVAAVADYRPVQVAKNKLKKTEQQLALHFEKTPDIVAAVTGLNPAPFTVGFAAESENLLKRRSKTLDMIAVNRVDHGDTGFDSDMNELLVMWEGGEQSLPRATKIEIAGSLMELIARRYHEKS